MENNTKDMEDGTQNGTPADDLNDNIEGISATEFKKGFTKKIKENYADVRKAFMGLYDSTYTEIQKETPNATADELHYSTIFNMANILTMLFRNEDVRNELRDDFIEIISDLLQSEGIKGKPEQQATLPLLKSQLPKNHLIPIQRLANELQHGQIIGMGEIDLIVANRGKKNEITTVVVATYEQPDGVTMTGKPYTEYDRQVQDAVSSLWEFGDESHVITPETVFRAMTHRTQTETPSPQQIGAVTKSLEKMRRIHITVDATEEMQKRKVTVDGKRVASCKFDDSLLSLRAIEVKAGGKTVKAYKITAEPVLLTYAKLTKQIATVPAERLDIKKVDKSGNVTPVSISNSDTRIAVKGYILRRIEIMKRDRRNKTQKQSNIILFDSLFEETDTPKDSNSANIKNYAFQVLDYYAATGYISGYTKRKKAGKGGGFDAAVIDL